MNRVEESIRFKQLLAYHATDGFFPIHEQAQARFDSELVDKIFGNANVNHDRIAKAGAWFQHVIESKEENE